MKRIITIIILFINNFKCLGQKDTIRIEHSFISYKQVIKSSIRYYSDSLSKYNACFYIEVYIVEFDTLKRRLSLSMDYTPYDPLAIHNPTHFCKINNKDVFIRFGNHFDYEIIKKLPFEIITKKEISYFKIDSDQCSEKAGSPTGYSQSFVFELKDNTQKYTWYKNAKYMPKEYWVFDTVYLNSRVKYDVYLSKKLKEYGYQ